MLSGRGARNVIMTCKLVVLLCCCFLLACSKAKPEDMKLFRDVYGNGKYGFMDKNRKILIYPAYDYAEDFSEGLAVFCLNRACGYLDSEGKIALQPVYEWTTSFIDGFAWAKLNGKWGILRKDGGFEVFAYDWVEFPLRDGFARVKLRDKLGLIDRSGKVILEPIFEKVYTDPLILNRDLFVVKLKGKYGLISTSGAYLIKPTFDDVDYEAFNRFMLLKYMRVKVDRELIYSEIKDPYEQSFRWGLVDRNGKIVLPPIVEVMRPITSKVAMVLSFGKWGLMNLKTLEFIVPPECEVMSNDIPQKIIRMKCHDKWGIADGQGKFIAPLEYQDIGLFQNGLAKARINGTRGFLDMEGNFTTEPEN